MAREYLQVHPDDNVYAALKDLKQGHLVETEQDSFHLAEDIPAKHKFTNIQLQVGEEVYMYGVLVGKAMTFIPKGGRIKSENTVHAVTEFGRREAKMEWQRPDVSRFAQRTFQGYRRADGRVGSMNYWLVIPLVFCENRNVEVIKEALLENLGYGIPKSMSLDVHSLVTKYKKGASTGELLAERISRTQEEQKVERIFPNVDGIKFLTHEGGCGGTRQDSDSLCRLLAGYITHANVAGATVLSLGCQHAQISILEEFIQKIDPSFAKPLHIFEQQGSKSEAEFIEDAVKYTFVGLVEANKCERVPSALEHLCLGLECGGSDGFSGISANPTLGYTSDLIVALGGSTILAEFPELNGVEQELINRCRTSELAEKFSELMKSYAESAEAVGSGFKNNPSPGNIKDGLITDAMKSAGAAKKGGTSPVEDVLDYAEPLVRKGLNLLCTPGNDVESTTGLAGSGANVIVFTTGLGTPTGNPVAPVIKLSSNDHLASKMFDIIDFNSGPVIRGEKSIENMGEELLEYIIQVASGEVVTNAMRLGQDDFIPWKRGVSL